MFVLDTNSIVHFFKGHEAVVKNWLRLEHEGLAMPAPVLYELLVGVEHSKTPSRRLTQLQAITPHVSLMPFGAREAADAATIRADLERRGCMIGPIDILIAATARANDATLVSHNLREFELVRNLDVVDWF